VGGVSQWEFLTGLKHLDAVSAMMGRLQEKLASRSRMVFHLTGDDPVSLLPSMERFIGSFPDRQVPAVRRTQPLIAPDEVRYRAFSLPSNVSYCALVHRSDPLSSPLQVAEMVLGQIMTTNDLWSSVRMKGGAYGVDARTNLSDHSFQFITYGIPASAAVSRITGRCCNGMRQRSLPRKRSRTQDFVDRPGTQAAGPQSGGDDFIQADFDAVR
jgi:Zn-dependent M16 (insulinase) family peptidase